MHEDHTSTYQPRFMTEQKDCMVWLSFRIVKLEYLMRLGVVAISIMLTRFVTLP